MKDKKEFVTTIFVQNEPAVIATGTTEDISVSNAIKAFESKGFEAPTVEKIETVQIPQRYTAAEMAQKGVDNYELMWQYIRESERAH